MNRIITFCAALMLTCALGVQAMAQSGYEVKGVVVDAAGPVIGATVLEQGTTTGTSTGNHLHFRIAIDGSTVDPRDYVNAQGKEPAKKLEWNK
jgi:hypothetical protein